MPRRPPGLGLLTDGAQKHRKTVDSHSGARQAGDSYGGGVMRVLLLLVVLFVAGIYGVKTLSPDAAGLDLLFPAGVFALATVRFLPVRRRR
jgi:hypothetical protein